MDVLVIAGAELGDEIGEVIQLVLIQSFDPAANPAGWPDHDPRL
jgi:hypothetical protein